MLTRLFTRSFATSSTAFKATKPTSPALLSLKVGEILQCKLHPDADKLYVSQIAHSSAQPLTVVSGLKDHIPIEEMQGKRVVLVTNLKPASMRGVVSEAMVLAAEKVQDDSVEGVELVVPPECAPVGAELEWRGIDEDFERVDGEKVRVSAKGWKKIQKNLATDGEGQVTYKTEEGINVLVHKETDKPCTVPSAFNSVVR